VALALVLFSSGATFSNLPNWLGAKGALPLASCCCCERLPCAIPERVRFGIDRAAEGPVQGGIILGREGASPVIALPVTCLLEAPAKLQLAPVFGKIYELCRLISFHSHNQPDF
jgi:hypothetical protein